MRRRVLVTRPEPGASRTNARLLVAGYEPVIVPLSMIAALRPELPAGEFDAVAISSANAAYNAPTELVARLAGMPVFTVGNETAAATREMGFSMVQSSAGAAAELANDVIANVAPGARIAYLCGRMRRDVIETELTAGGIDMTAIETYDTLARSPTAEEMAELDRAPVAVALIYSAMAAEALAGLVEPRSGTIFRDTTFIAISERVARGLDLVAPGRVVAAATPDEDAMFQSLVRVGH